MTTTFPMHTQKPVADLIPYARNPRTHSEVQVAQIAASIKEFGFLNPIIIDGENGIEATGATFGEMAAGGTKAIAEAV